MKKKGGKRVQIKRLKSNGFQIKQVFDLQKDPFYLLNTLQKLEAAPQIANPHTYHLISLDFEINYLDYRQYPKQIPAIPLISYGIFYTED